MQLHCFGMKHLFHLHTNQNPKKSNVKAKAPIKKLFLKYPCGVDVWLIALTQAIVGNEVSAFSCYVKPPTPSAYQLTDNAPARLKNNHIEIQNSVYVFVIGFIMCCKFREILVSLF